MNKIAFKVFYPGGNITALVYEDIPQIKHAELAKLIMRDNHDIEQVGFVNLKKELPKLNMMGGEFCGGAAICYIFNSGLSKITMEVSGFPRPINGLRYGNDVTLILPKDFFVSAQDVEQGKLVDLHGIRFLLTELDFLEQEREALLKKYADEYPAVGIIKFKKIDSKSYSITPWVWVKGTDSLIPETACSSGSIAMAWLAKSLTNNKEFFIIQPSGAKFALSFENNNNINLKTEVKDLGERVISGFDFN